MVIGKIMISDVYPHKTVILLMESNMNFEKWAPFFDHGRKIGRFFHGKNFDQNKDFST